ncbi:MAG: urease accessory protein UreD [Burkholderiaceae bacterium]
MGWHAELRLDYRVEHGRCLARHRHMGPLRILQILYPEGDAVCHNVVVHPPSGLVGGDVLDTAITVGTGAHGLVTTPGATRFYRSDGETAVQRTQIALAPGARFEWLPLSAICSSGCIAENTLVVRPDADSELIGWDMCALGLPASNQPFQRGSIRQRIEVPGIWLEQARIDAQDDLLMNGTLGLAGQRCVGTLFFITGTVLPRVRREAVLEAARGAIGSHALAPTAGATSPHPQIVIVRALGPLVEPVFELLRRVRAVWRAELWQLPATEPRGWAN